MLRRGKLLATNGDKVYNASKMADKIDDWVREQFMMRFEEKDFDRDKIVIDAMIGFLYKQAVDEFRKGNLGTLGYKEAADAIDSWVNKKFLERQTEGVL